MKIGLLRHYKVNVHEPEGKLNSIEYNNWRNFYDKNEDIISSKVDLGNVLWTNCFSSSLIRAVKTAEDVFYGEINITDLLREVDMKFAFEIEDYRKIYDWDIYSMISWAKNDGVVVETLEDTKLRASEFLSLLENNHSGENILVVSHGTMMRVLEELLRENNYLGNRIIGPENGELYIFTKNK